MEQWMRVPFYSDHEGCINGIRRIIGREKSLRNTSTNHHETARWSFIPDSMTAFSFLGLPCRQQLARQFSQRLSPRNVSNTPNPSLPRFLHKLPCCLHQIRNGPTLTLFLKMPLPSLRPFRRFSRRLQFIVLDIFTRYCSVFEQLNKFWKSWGAIWDLRAVVIFMNQYWICEKSSFGFDSSTHGSCIHDIV
jgi:hypothetical protein